MSRDAGRVRIKFPALSSDGTAVGDIVTAYACVTGNVSWSGFKRSSIQTTCTETVADGWDNIVRTFRAGGFIDMGTLTLDVDWDPSNTDEVNSAFRERTNKNYQIDFPAETGETTGPTIVVPGHFTDMTPITDVLSDGDGARCRATLVLKLSGDWTITDAVAAS